MSDVSPETEYAEYATQDGPGSANADGDADTPAERRRPEEKAHGGSMAPGLVDDAGRQTAEPPPGDPY
ncbi:hypothetical protein Ade02nite_90880 [Paractinoplanes deccanensis]|uniref:Uncharacterized protein n=1 Tax=Paractinoplanes deccanensis TaxID=113561 RepID=A0ABQ3YKD9_9ACTN|nr:hypothetical protein [Actinoplanes deccanensis]GID80447.1 hypothetical protein Ade02nite_90880 [Actinoplanes deccanensis]